MSKNSFLRYAEENETSKKDNLLSDIKEEIRQLQLALKDIESGPGVYCNTGILEILIGGNSIGLSAKELLIATQLRRNMESLYMMRSPRMEEE